MELIDSFYVPEDQDEGGPRMYYRVIKCPCRDDCSEQSWAKVQAWSFIDQEYAKNMVVNHLMKSSLHGMTEEEAESLRDEMEIQVIEETEKERDDYRKHIDRIERNKRKTQWEEPSKDSYKGGNKSNTRYKSNGKGGDNKGGYGNGNGIVALQRQAINPQSLGMLTDSIDRARGSVSSAITMFTKSAVAFNERAHACSSTVSNLQDELTTLSAARECVQQIQLRVQSMAASSQD